MRRAEKLRARGCCSEKRRVMASPRRSWPTCARCRSSTAARSSNDTPLLQPMCWVVRVVVASHSCTVTTSCVIGSCPRAIRRPHT
jgi:hypothetical protein